MTHLKIEQPVGYVEYVADSVVEKLYELATNSTLDNESNLQGTVHIDTGYRDHINTITTNYPDFHVQADNYLIPFEDPNMVTYLNSIGVGSNGTITEAQAAIATSVANSVNTTVTKFNELKYFTNITESLGGLSGNQNGAISFRGWTALEEVDVSNFTSIGRNHGNGNYDNFYGCTSLKTVTASSKLKTLAFYAFKDCSNLESITGLEGTIYIGNDALKNCSKLTDSVIENVVFEPMLDSNGYKTAGGALAGTNFKEVTLSSNTTELPSQFFYLCKNLETVNGLQNITDYGSQCFYSCSKFTGPIDFTNVTHIGGSAFTSSGLTGAVNLQSIQTIDYGSNFINTKITSVDFHGKNLSFNGEFSGCTQLTTVTGTQNMTTIHNNMFISCTALTTIDLSNVTSIGSSAFKGCSSLSNIDLSNVTSIGSQAFQSCSSLTTVGDLSNCTSIGRNAFDSCSNLDKTDWDLSNVTHLGQYAFYGCSKLKGTLNLSGVQTINVLTTELFSGCSNLEKMILGHISSVETSRTGATRSTFYGCNSLKVVDINQLDSIKFSNAILIDNNVFQAFIIRNTDSIPTITLDQGTSTALWSKFTSSSNAKIYVDDNLYSTYINDSSWSDLASHIEPLSNYTES